jgi:transporter family-2 protein
MTGWLLVIVPVLAGVASTLQATSNGALASRVGLPGALLISISVSTAAILVLYLAQGSETGLFPPNTPWVLYLGGVYGFLILAALAFAFPRIGGAWTIALLVLGQGLAALAVDHFGLLGQPRDPLTVVRAAGVALVVAGTLLMRWR